MSLGTTIKVLTMLESACNVLILELMTFFDGLINL